jgi:amylovoran biosynthesis protein AmsC
MVPFWILFSFIAFFSVVFPSYSTQRVRYLNISFYSFIVGACLVLFAGLRFESNDYQGYVDIYNAIPPIYKLNSQWFENNFLNVEIGFIYFCSILKLFSGDPILLFFVVALISITLNFVAIKKLSPYVFISILLYYVYNFLLKDTIQIRQGLASALVMNSFVFHKSRIKSILLVILAISIQSTSIVALPLIFLSDHTFNKAKKYYFILGLTFFISIIFSGRQAFEFLMSIMQLPASVSVYFGWEEFDYKLGYLNPILIKQLVITVILIKFREQLIDKYSSFTLIFNFYFFSTIWYIYFNDFAIIAGRISNLLSIGEVVLIPMLLSVISNNKRLYIYLILILYSMAVLTLNLNTGKIFPYKLILGQ